MRKSFLLQKITVNKHQIPINRHSEKASMCFWVRWGSTWNFTVKFFYRSPTPTAIPWPTPQNNLPNTSSFHGHPPPPAAIITNNQLQRNTYSQAQGTAMVSRVLPVKKPDLTPPEVSSSLDRRLTPEVSNLDQRLTLSPEASNLSTVIQNNERSFNNTNANNQRLGRVQGLDPLAIKRAGKSHFIY